MINAYAKENSVVLFKFFSHAPWTYSLDRKLVYQPSILK